MEVKVGDWVSFIAGSTVIYASVLYVREPKAWETAMNEVVTTAGPVAKQMVLEVRRAPEQG